MPDVAERTRNDEAIELIDGALPTFMSRELVSTDEMSDLLIDIRNLLIPQEA